MPPDPLDQPVEAWWRWHLVALAAAVSAIGQLEAWAPAEHFGHLVGPRAVVAAVYAATAASVVFLRRSPLAVLVFIAAVTSIEYLGFGASEGLGSLFPLLIALYYVGRYEPDPSVIVGAVVGALGLAVHELKDPEFRFEGSAVVFWALLGATMLVGYGFQRRERAHRESESRASALLAVQERDAEVAVADERARMARELHDVIGHSIGVIVLQLGAASGLLEHDETEQAAVRLRSAEETARQSLLEMRRLVGLLDLGDDPDLHPQPGVADLDALISQVRAAGVPVELRVCGEERPVTPGLGLAVYRIVQEALTNVIKHAAGAPTTVSVEYRPHDLLVEVRDAGAHTNRGKGDAGARGVAGMRARAALYGGRLTAAADEPGGFRVAAELPFET